MADVTSHAPGSFSWPELATTDQKGAVAFYRALFGWDLKETPLGPTEMYSMFQMRDKEVAAAYTMRPDERQGGAPPHWNSYVTVANVDVPGVVGHGLELAGAEVRRAAWVGRAEDDLRKHTDAVTSAHFSLDGKRVVIPSRAAQSLFAFLILKAGTIHRREILAGTFWPDTSDEAARKNLRQELRRIRKALSAQQPAEDNYLLAAEFTLTFTRYMSLLP